MLKGKKIAQRAIASAIAAVLLSTSALDYTAQAAVVTDVSEAESILIGEYGGWLESGYVEWTPISAVESYQVYYKSAEADDSTYCKIDQELIRQYADYYRADLLGLEAGSYDVKVVPVVGGITMDELSETKEITVEAQTREGFAFSSESPMGTGSGGYSDDGTVPENAQIVYVTSETVNTVTLDVITNSKGTTTTCTGLTDILAKRQKGYDKTPLIIRVIGTIKSDDISGLNSNGYIQIKGCYNLSFEGVGEDATVYGWGILVRDAHNVEIKNLGIMLFPDDGISLDTDNENIWVHNNDIFYGTAGSDSDQAKGDGSCDVKGYSNYVTISYNHFWDSGKCSLCGMSDSKEFFVTYHHNWFDHSDSRHPRIRVGSIHIYNNYFDGNAKYGVGVTKGASAFVEANYFRNCKYPMLSSLQGSDVYGDNEGTFSSEAGGIIKAFSNLIVGATRLVYAQEDSVEFDAYLASEREEQVSAAYTTVSGGTTYNNFDTASTMYEYEADAAEDVESIVTTYSGRMNGGDFDFEFNDEVDDEDYSVNQELMSAIRSYESSLVDATPGDSEGTATEVPVVTTSAPVESSSVPSATTTSSTAVTTSPVVSETPEVGELTSTGMYTNLASMEDSSFATVLYAAPDGTSTGDGSYDAPYDLVTALSESAQMDGVAILLKEGTYSYAEQITIPVTNSGKSTSYKVLKACKGANVTLDFSSQTYSDETSTNARGIQLNASYWYLGQFTVYGAADNGIMVSGSYNIIENCVLDSNRDTGLQISRSSSSVTNFEDWPSNNYIINCTSKNNCDPASYENADGFAAKLTCGDGNVFDGCLSYNNSDDGWDLYAKTETGAIGVVTIRNCIAMRNGMTEDGTTKSSCDGNGFKLGGSGVGTPHVIINCLAIENLHHGFTDNNNPSALTIVNCTAFNNNQGGSKNNFSLYRCQDAYVANCISYTTSSSTSDKYLNLSAERTVLYNSSKWYKVTDLQVMNTGSSSSRGEVLTSGVTASDFISSSVPTVGTDFNEIWRNENGTLNTNGIAIVSSSSVYGTFATDGYAIGARFSSDNSATMIEVGSELPSVVVPSATPSVSPSASVSPAVSENPETTASVIPSTVPVEGDEVIHNFTEDGLNSSYFSISGNLSTAKGTSSYNGLSLTSCLKIESATSISFTTDRSGVLTLVFNTDCSKSIYIDGTAYTAVNGILTADLEAGEHVITKKDSINLYYISLVLETAGEPEASEPVASVVPTGTGTVGGGEEEVTEPTTSTPVTSEVPVTTSPEVSEVPVTSTTPVISEVPVTSTTPEASEVPVASTTPEASEVPAASTTPVTSEVPVTSTTPVTSEVPVTSTPPVASETPATATVSPSTSVSPSPSAVIKPVKVTTVKTSKQTSTSITLTWKKQTGVSGYQIVVYNTTTKKYFTAATVTSNKNTCTISKISGKALTAGKTYTFKIRAYKTVSGSKTYGSYSATIKTATIPKTTALTVKSGSKKAVLTWKKVTQATGYEIYQSTSKSSGYSKVKTISSNATLKYTKTSLKKGKTYYFKIRSYKVVNGKKIYSSFSTVKKVTVQ